MKIKTTYKMWKKIKNRIIKVQILFAVQNHWNAPIFSTAEAEILLHFCKWPKLRAWKRFQTKLIEKVQSNRKIKTMKDPVNNTFDLVPARHTHRRFILYISVQDSLYHEIQRSRINAEKSISRISKLRNPKTKCQCPSRAPTRRPGS